MFRVALGQRTMQIHTMRPKHFTQRSWTLEVWDFGLGTGNGVGSVMVVALVASRLTHWKNNRGIMSRRETCGWSCAVVTAGVLYTVQHETLRKT